MSAIERRKALIDAIDPSPDAVTVAPVEAYLSVLTYFDEHEPAVAKAIRFGLEPAHVQLHGQGVGALLADQGLYRIKDESDG